MIVFVFIRACCPSNGPSRAFCSVTYPCSQGELLRPSSVSTCSALQSKELIAFLKPLRLFEKFGLHEFRTSIFRTAQYLCSGLIL